MELSAEHDGVAREWVSGFERSFQAAERILALDGPVPERAARVYRGLLAAELDTHVATEHDAATAECVRERAAAASTLEKLDALAEDFVAEEINPGTTADLTAAGLFIALERGLDV